MNPFSLYIGVVATCTISKAIVGSKQGYGIDTFGTITGATTGAIVGLTSPVSLPLLAISGSISVIGDKLNKKK